MTLWARWKFLGRAELPPFAQYTKDQHGPKACFGWRCCSWNPSDCWSGAQHGVADVAALAEVLADARRLGLDIGSTQVLRKYDRWRVFDNTVMLASTDGLNRLFSNDIAPIRMARDLGLAAVNRAGPLKIPHRGRLWG